MSTQVLIIEDNVTLRETLIDAFEVDGYNTSSATNGQQGLERVQASRPDLIISDIMMPVMDGIELVKKLKANPETELIPVILLTAKSMQEDRLLGLGHGANDYITKPFDLKELLLRAKNLIDHQHKVNSRNILKPDQVSVDSQDDLFLKDVKGSIDRHLSDLNYSLKILADECCYSVSTIQKKIKKLTGKSVSQLIREYRLDRGRQLLLAKVGSVSQVAAMVGFNSLSYFSSCYKAYFGNNPTDDVK